MHLIVCLDDRDGMLFNKRRQSSDRAVCAHIMEQQRQPLCVSPYSAKLFSDYTDRLLISQDPLAECPDDGVCFLEDMALEPYLGRMTKLTVYRWNRHYPADRKFPMQTYFANWHCVEKLDFSGNSHEQITWEVYER